MSDYRSIPVEELTNLLKEKHSQLKAHPFWSSPDLDVFKKEIEPKFRKILDIIYGFKNRYIEFDDNHPFICMYSDGYHAFSGKLGLCKNYMDSSRQKEFEQFFVPMMQDYLNLIQSFLDGKTDPESYKLRIPKWSDTKGKYEFNLYIPVFKKSWVNSDGFNFYPSYILGKRGVWFMKRCITGKEVTEVIKGLNRQIKTYKKYLSIHKTDSSIQKDLDKCYAILKDINEKTDFWYHVY